MRDSDLCDEAVVAHRGGRGRGRVAAVDVVAVSRRRLRRCGLVQRRLLLLRAMNGLRTHHDRVRAPVVPPPRVHPRCSCLLPPAPLLLLDVFLVAPATARAAAQAEEHEEKQAAEDGERAADGRSDDHRRRGARRVGAARRAALLLR